MCAGVNLPGAGSNDPTLQLAATLDAMDHFLQSGWLTHAWSAGWMIPGVLAGIGHLEQAATWLGACLVCGFPRVANVVLPDELEAALAGGGDPRFHDAISAGKQFTFADLRRLTDDAMRT